MLGPHPDAPETLLTSLEVDLYPRANPSLAEEIDGAIGDGSPFHEMYGYYAHGVGPETAKAPYGWQDRLIPVTIHTKQGSRATITAWCLAPDDLVLAKLVAGRPHDIEYAVEALRAGIVTAETLQRGVDLLEPRFRRLVTGRLDGLIRRGATA